MPVILHLLQSIYKAPSTNISKRFPCARDDAMPDAWILSIYRRSSTIKVRHYSQILVTAYRAAEIDDVLMHFFDIA